MKERPILFSAPMVRALLAGTKTQTRRVAKNLPHESEYEPGLFSMMVVRDGKLMEATGGVGMLKPLCPYGQPGDRLWVRETWTEWEGTFLYRADFEGCEVAWKWTPSIHMPRKSSRITLEVTAVRVERLQDISEEDAKAEGAGGERYIGQGFDHCVHREAYRTLWNDINGPGSWDANPWVWVVEFKFI